MQFQIHAVRMIWSDWRKTVVVMGSTLILKEDIPLLKVQQIGQLKLVQNPKWCDFKFHYVCEIVAVVSDEHAPARFVIDKRKVIIE